MINNQQLFHKGISYINVKLLLKNINEYKHPQKHLKFVNMYRILLRDDFKCINCGCNDFLTIDHFGHGMTKSCFNSSNKYNEWNKCKTLCVDCHLEKNKTLVDAGIEIKLRNIFCSI